MESLIINLLSGAVGGNVAGALMKNFSLGTLGNSIVGILGGGIGGQVLNMLGMAAGGDGSLDIGNIVSSVGAGGVGGGILLAVIGVVKKALA